MKLLMIIVLALSFFSASIQPAVAAKVLKLGHMMPLVSIEQTSALKFKELVETRSNGRLKIEIYPAGQLGRDKDILEALQFGSLDLGVITTSPQTNFAKEIGTLDVPYLFKDWDHVAKMMHSDFYDDLLQSTEKAMFYNFSLLPRGFRNVTNNTRPIVKPSDMKGLKIRVIESPVFIDTFNALGASPQAMSWGEVFTALQQGAIDGQENPMITIYDEHVYEVQKYVSKTRHIFAFASLCGSKMLFDGYPKEDQDLIRQAARDTSSYMMDQVRADTQNIQDKLVTKGMKVNEVDAEAFRSLIKPVQEKIAEGYSFDFFKKIKALAK